MSSLHSAIHSLTPYFGNFDWIDLELAGGCLLSTFAMVIYSQSRGTLTVIKGEDLYIDRYHRRIRDLLILSFGICL